MKTPVILLTLLSLLAPAVAHDVKGGRFYYDPVDYLITAKLKPENEYRYEPSLSRNPQTGSTLITMLEFTPGEGDRITIGELSEHESLTNIQTTVAQPGQYRRPTITADSQGREWLTFEAFKDGTWSIFIQPADKPDENPARINTSRTNAINHTIAALPETGLIVAWQEDRGGQWDIVSRKRITDGDWREPRVLSEQNRLGDWHPSVAVHGEKSFVVWDAYDGKSFSVRGRFGEGDGWGELIRITDSAAFEGRAKAAYDKDGRLFVAWEEGAKNWGKEYRRFLADPPNFNDDHGGLHRYRLLRLAEVDEDAKVKPIAVPMPSLDAAADRDGARPNTERLGLFYERPVITVDESNRLWMVYHHYYYPEVALDKRPTSHVEEGWRLYARCLRDGKWSDAIGLEPTQRDGMQRLSIVSDGENLVTAWTVGRTHRGSPSPQRGVATARFSLPESAQFHKQEAKPWAMKTPSNGPGEREPDFAPESVGGTEYEVFFGDLHRHTDLSLCRVYFDGSIDDAYRYAIEAAELDFLGITDHSRDLSNGDHQSQLWWRSIKEVTRHRLSDTFFPMFAFERSHGETDHNVISLRDDMLRTHKPPLKDYWELIDHDTFTVPHNPIRPLRAFAYQDDKKRPLLEIYQGCRSNPMTKEAHDGLNRGYQMGFIASSDHLATRTSYACVWSPERDRESIFRSLQARRTYGATAKIRLVFRSGDHWMGERIQTDAMPIFQYEVDGENDLKAIEVIRDGKVVRTIPNESGGRGMSGKFRGPGEFKSRTWIYIHAIQNDGEAAWSSPIWLD